MGYKSNEEGYEVTAIFKGVSSDKLADSKLLKDVSLDLLKKAGFSILDKVEHKFTPQGYTFVVLLAESHFAVHTYPEYDSVYFHLYSCGNKDEKIIFEGLKNVLEPKKVVLRKELVRVAD